MAFLRDWGEFFSFKKTLWPNLFIAWMGLVGVIFFNWAALIGIKSTIWGDWQEYLMMQVGIAEFGRISVVPEAALLAEKYIQQEDSSLRLFWKDDFLNLYNRNLPSVAGAYRSPQDGHYYFGHFFFYNLLTFPAHHLCKVIGISPFRAMTLTNAWLISLVLMYLSVEKKLLPKARFWAILLAVFSPMSWYLDFKGPEVLTQASVFAAAIAWLAGRPILSAFFILPGSLQNPSAAIFFLLLIASLLFRKEYRKLFLTGGISLLSLLPALFYYVKFNQPNLLVAGFIHPANITLRRLAGAYLDVQQGMVVGFPFVLLAFAFLCLNSLRNKDFAGWIFLPLSALMLLPLLAQENWHPGQIHILRYGAWVGMLFQASLLFSYQYVSDFSPTLRFIISVCIICNSYYIASLGFVWQHDYYYCDFNKAARWLLNHYPAYYNPDIEIFAECVFKEEKDFSKDSLIIYRDPASGEIKKVAIRWPADAKDLTDTLGDYYRRHQNVKVVEKGWAYLIP